MKNECSIILDLLPLYAEGMVSENTAAFVEEHLASCPSCTAELAKVKSPSQIDPVQAEQAVIQSIPLTAAKKMLRKKQMFTIFVAAAITALVTISLCIALEIQQLFWLIYVFIPIVALTLFAIWRPKFIWLSIPICVAMDFIFFMDEFLYYESTILMLLCTAVQAAIVAIVSLIIYIRSQKH